MNGRRRNTERNERQRVELGDGRRENFKQVGFRRYTKGLKVEVRIKKWEIILGKKDARGRVCFSSFKRNYTIPRR